MADFVSEKKIAEFQNAFFYFAHRGTGVLKAKQMGEVMRQNTLDYNLYVYYHYISNMGF